MFSCSSVLSSLRPLAVPLTARSLRGTPLSGRGGPVAALSTLSSFQRNNTAQYPIVPSLRSVPLQTAEAAGTVTVQQVRHRSNRSRRGLYNGKDIRAGNNVSFSMKKTKRKFRPNVFKKRVYSEILDEMIPFHITASALRDIDKAGGLDNYLLTSKHVTEGEGQKAKNRIMQRMKLWEKKRQMAEEAGVLFEDPLKIVIEKKDS